MAVGTPTTSEGNSTTPSVAVPTGVASGDIVVLLVTKDVGSANFTGKWPTGFTQFVDATGTFDGQSYGIAWKRLTGSDSGSYTLSALASSSPWLMAAIPLTGRHATDPAVISANNFNNAGAASPMTITALTVTAVAGDDILFVSMPDVSASGAGAGHSAWSAGYTEILDLENTLGGGNDWGNLGVAKAENVGAGATGSKTVTFTSSTNAGWGAWLIRVPAGAGGTDATVTAVPMAGTGAFPVPVLSAGATVTGVLMDGTGALVAPVLSAGATVTSVTMAGTGALVAPAVSSGTSATVTAVPMAGTGALIAPTVSAGSTVTSVPLAGTGAFPPANGIMSAVVTATPMSGTGALPAPSVSGTGDAAVTAPAMAGIGDLVAPSVTATATVTSVPAQGVGDIPTPALAAGATVTSVPLQGTGDLPAPAANATGDVTIAPPTFAGTGDLLTPSTFATATIVATLLQGAGDLPTPAFIGPPIRRWQLDDPVIRWPASTNTRWD